MEDISLRFSIIEDPRHSGYVTHKLGDVLTIVMCAVLCGLDRLDEIMTYQENNVEGKVMTADVMHCQKETCRKIKEKKGDYVLGLKENHPTLYSDINLYFSDSELQKSLECHKTLEKNRGRVERRICRKLTDLSWLEGREAWEGLCCVFSIERIVETSKKRSHEISYYNLPAVLWPQALSIRPLQRRASQRSRVACLSRPFFNNCR